PTPLVGGPEEDVGRPTLGGGAANRLHEVVAVRLEEMDPEDARESAESRQLGRFLLGGLVVGRAHPESVDLGVQPLGGTPRAAENALRLRLWLDQRQDALAHRLLAERLEAGGLTARLDVFCELA